MISFLLSPRSRAGRSPAGHRRQERHLVAVAERLIHPRVVGVDRARDRPLVARQLGKLPDQLPPHRSDRRAGADLPRQLGAPAMSRSRANSRTVTRMPPAPPRARARSSSGSAVAPSIQTSPPSKNSRFQIGRDLLHPLDRVAARRERVAAVRRRRRDRHARLADLEPPDPVMQRQPDARPPGLDLAARSARTPGAPAARTPRTRDTGRCRPSVVVAHQAEKRRDGAIRRRRTVRPGAHGGHQRLERQRLRARSRAAESSSQYKGAAPCSVSARSPQDQLHAARCTPRSTQSAVASRSDRAGRGRGRSAGRAGWRRPRRSAPAPVASRSGWPSARYAAMAEANVQPVPCVFVVWMRGVANSMNRSPSNSRSTSSSPLAVAALDDRPPRRRARGCGAPPRARRHGEAIRPPASTSASGMFGVTTQRAAAAARPRSVRTPSSSSSRRRSWRPSPDRRRRAAGRAP